jgi:DNA-binding IclR family transcriptional regulator
MALDLRGTVDATIAVLESAARAREGITLAELAENTATSVSTISEVVARLLATGYLVAREDRYLLGPGAFVLALHGAGRQHRQVQREELDFAQAQVKVPLFVGVRVGDDQVFIDRVGDNILPDFVSEHRPRRPLLTTATGKIILAWMDPDDREEFLARRSRDDPAAVSAFRRQFEEIRSSRLAFNPGLTVPDRFTVATPLCDPEGHFLAAICAVGGPEIADRLEAVGQDLLSAVLSWRFNRRRRRI